MPETLIILALLAVLILVVIALSGLAFRLGVRHAHRSETELTRLNELSRRLLRSQLSVDELCELVYWQAGQVIPATLFQLGLFEGNGYRIKVWVRESERLPESFFPQGGLKGIIGWIRTSGQSLLIRDFDAERERLPAFPEHDLDRPPRSGLFVPLIAGASTIGIVAVQSYQVGRFNEDHIRLLTALANQTAWAIRNAQLYERAQYRAEQLKLIGQISAQVSAVQPLPALFRQIVTLCRDTFGYYCVSIFVQEGDKLEIGASTSDGLAHDVPSIKMGVGMIGWAAQHGLPAFARDVAEDSRYRTLGVLPETRSEIALPLKVETRVLGVLDVQSDRVDAFDEEDISLLETLAAQVALAIEQAQTYAAERQLAERLETLMQVSQAVVSILDLEDLLDHVTDLIADTFGFERAHIFLQTDGKLTLRASVGPRSVRWLVDGLSYTLDSPGLIPETARAGVAQLVADVSQLKDDRLDPNFADTRSELAVPLKMANRVLGVIDLQSDLVEAFTSEDLVLMQALADTVAVAIRNAALYAGERRRRNLADALREIGATLVSDLHLDHVLRGILEGLRSVVSLDSAAILLFEQETEVLTVAATIGVGTEQVVGQQLLLGEIETEGETSLENLVSELYHDLINLSTEQVCIIAPLIVSGRLIGYLVTDHDHPDQHSTHDGEIVLTFANQAAIAINNAHLYTSQQAEAWVTTALLQVAEAVNAQVDVAESLEAIARLTTLLAGVTRCLILCWNASERTYILGGQHGIPQDRYSAAVEPLHAEQHPFLDLMSVTNRLVGAGEGHELPIPAPLVGLLDSPSILAIPLRAKQELVGLLIVDDPRQGQPLDSRLLTILTGIAHQTATALETATLQASAAERERLEQELRVAHDIQASFIPSSPPQLAGWEIAAAWRAARQVGGDFYDFIPLRDGRWGLVIADVADKGIPAALFMAMCRTLLRAAAINRLSPASTLERVNQLLFNDSRSDLFVTVFYAVWDPTSGEVTFASGGHTPALLMAGKKGKAIELRSRGIALGVLPEIQLEEHRTTIHPGDMLVAYTDGVTEAMQADYTEWGTERFIDALCDVYDRPIPSVVEGILDAIERFVGDAPQHDDLTFWILKCASEQK